MGNQAMNDLQRRYLPCDSGIIEEIRSSEGESTYKIKGTPIVYGRETVIYDSEHFRWIETIEPGAAREALLRAEQVLLWNHDSSKPMAARKNNTLIVKEDNTGVHIEANASGTVWGREGVEAIRGGLIDKMSFGFFVKPEGYTEERSTENGKRILKRSIKKFDRIIDFSPVTYPAYQDTEVSARNAEEIIKEMEIEENKRAETKKKINDLLAEYGKYTTE